MARHGKRYLEASKRIDRTRLYDPEEAVRLLKQTATAKFPETVEAHVRLGVDPKHADQQVRGTVTLPAGTGKRVRVAVFAKGEKAKEAEAAGADLFLMPSRFEPSGLNQLYSMRYGTLPVVRRTGGLADSVVDATPDAVARGRATGFVFDAYAPEGLQAALSRALAAYRDGPTWHRLQQAAMRQDFSWDRSARRYADLYALTVERAQAAALH